MARAVHIEESVRIRRSPDDVWATVADYGSDHLWRPGITEMTPDPPGPPAAGTRVHEVLNTGGRSYVTDSTVTTVGPGMKYRFSGSGTTGKVEGGRSVDAGNTPDEAVFTYTVELTLKGGLRLLRPIVATRCERTSEATSSACGNCSSTAPEALTASRSAGRSAPRR
jgi:Polyketide cyclase / dehydrase and lipid transport